MKIHHPRFEISVLSLLCAAMATGTTASAATNTGSTDELPKLLPPHGMLPQTFWDRHGTTLIIAGVGLFLLAAFGNWLRLRPKLAVIVPPDVRARQALSVLLQRPEDGVLLSSVSQILRRYVIVAFDLPLTEPTTLEFCRAVAGDGKIGPELSTSLADFLRRCDERKFSPSSSAAPLGSASRALELIELAESRRAELKKAAATQAQRETSQQL